MPIARKALVALGVLVLILGSPAVAQMTYNESPMLAEMVAAHAQPDVDLRAGGWGVLAVGQLDDQLRRRVAAAVEVEVLEDRRPVGPEGLLPGEGAEPAVRRGDGEQAEQDGQARQAAKARGQGGHVNAWLPRPAWSLSGPSGW